MKKLIAGVCVCLSIKIMAIENFPDSHDDHHHHVVGNSYKENSANQRFSCDLRVYIGQCRDYEILDNAQTTLAEIKEGCESMSGLFSEQTCVETKRLSVCSDIIRNYHQPDVIYTNTYYEDQKSNWTVASTQRICGDLGGEFFIP